MVNPHVYHVSLSQRLWDLKQELIRQARAGSGQVEVQQSLESESRVANHT
jgi:hypothetical protein